MKPGVRFLHERRHDDVRSTGREYERLHDSSRGSFGQSRFSELDHYFLRVRDVRGVPF